MTLPADAGSISGTATRLTHTPGSGGASPWPASQSKKPVVEASMTTYGVVVVDNVIYGGAVKVIIRLVKVNGALSPNVTTCSNCGPMAGLKLALP